MRLIQRLRQRRGAGEGYDGFCLLASCLFAVAAILLFTGEARAYPCITRATETHTDERCRPQRRAIRARHHSSFAELALAGGIFLAILLVPVVPKNLGLWDDDRRTGRGQF